jgi:hypothetical protein
MVRLPLMPASYRIKFDRAVEHFHLLNAAILRWAVRDPCAVVHECEVETRKYVVRMRVFEQPTDPLLPLLIGDCVHNLRQALDHLAYALAVIVHGCDPPPNSETTEFPILHGDRHQFDSELSKKIGPKKRVPRDLYAELEALQPYNGPQNALLSILHDLDRLDKHRFPPIVAGAIEVPNFAIGELAGSQVFGPRVGAIEDGAVILSYIPIPGSKVEMDAQFRPSIAFDQGQTTAGGQLVVNVLGNMLGFVGQNVFPRLEPFLP